MANEIHEIKFFPSNLVNTIIADSKDVFGVIPAVSNWYIEGNIDSPRRVFGLNNSGQTTIEYAYYPITQSPSTKFLRQENLITTLTFDTDGNLVKEETNNLESGDFRIEKYAIQDGVLAETTITRGIGNKVIDIVSFEGKEDGDGKSTTTVYDLKTNTPSETTTFDKSVLISRIYYYNNMNAIKTYIEFYPNGDSKNRSEYKKSGQKISHIIFYPGNKIKSTTRYFSNAESVKFYDENGNLTHSEEWKDKPNGNRYYIDIYFGVNGKRKKKVETGGGKKVVTTYDGNKRKVIMKSLNSNEKSIKNFVDGILVREYTFIGNTEITYTNDGKSIVTEIKDNDTNIVYTTVQDEKGVLKKEITEDSMGKSEVEYDEKGNIVYTREEGKFGEEKVYKIDGKTIIVRGHEKIIIEGEKDDPDRQEIIFIKGRHKKTRVYKNGKLAADYFFSQRKNYSENGPSVIFYDKKGKVIEEYYNDRDEKLFKKIIKNDRGDLEIFLEKKEEKNPDKIFHKKDGGKFYSYNIGDEWYDEKGEILRCDFKNPCDSISCNLGSQLCEVTKNNFRYKDSSFSGPYLLITSALENAYKNDPDLKCDWGQNVLLNESLTDNTIANLQNILSNSEDKNDEPDDILAFIFLSKDKNSFVFCETYQSIYNFVKSTIDSKTYSTGFRVTPIQLKFLMNREKELEKTTHFNKFLRISKAKADTIKKYNLNFQAFFKFPVTNYRISLADMEAILNSNTNMFFILESSIRWIDTNPLTSSTHHNYSRNENLEGDPYYVVVPFHGGSIQNRNIDGLLSNFNFMENINEVVIFYLQ